MTGSARLFRRMPCLMHQKLWLGIIKNVADASFWRIKNVAGPSVYLLPINSFKYFNEQKYWMAIIWDLLLIRELPSFVRFRLKDCGNNYRYISWQDQETRSSHLEFICPFISLLLLQFSSLRLKYYAHNFAVMHMALSHSGFYALLDGDLYSKWKRDCCCHFAPKSIGAAAVMLVLMKTTFEHNNDYFDYYTWLLHMKG